MLLKFSIQNYLSFLEKQEITFDHEYNTANIFKNNIIFEYKEDKKKRAVLNGAILLGANAAGKTNIVLALNQMSKYYRNSIKFDKKSDLNTLVRKFKFSEDNDNPVVFLVEFMEFIDGDYYKIIYTFSINASNSLIETEVLSYQKVLKTTLAKEVIIFNRVRDNIKKFPKDINNIINKIKQENIKYKLVLSLINFDINETFFKNEISSLTFKIASLCGESIEKKLLYSGESSNMDEFIEAIEENPDFKDYILSNLYDFDFALTDFKIQDISEEFVDVLIKNNFLDQVNNESKESLLQKFKRYKLETIHNVNNNDYELSIGDESAGTKKFLNHALKIYESILMQKVYISDEFDSHYHIHIQEGIIKNFIYPESISKTQFLIITHNPILLNPNFFAKEQVYFVEKNRTNQDSHIFSLKDFKDISYNNHNWTDLYLSGRIGAVPEVFS